MTPQEKDLITTLLTRLKSAGGQQKDADADTLIRQAAAEQPDAPYYLVQTVLIQDLSLHNAQNRIAELEHQLSDAQAVQKPTSFLGGLFGHAAPAAAPVPQPQPQPGSVPPAGPWTRAPQVAAAPPPGYGAPGYGQPMGGGVMSSMGAGGGGFLRSAATTAAGIAGGALLFEGISSLFGHSAGYGMLGGQPMMPGLGESVVNNYYGDQGGGGAWGSGDQDFASAGGYDPGAGQDTAGQDQGGQDFGSDQDFSGGDSGGSDDSGGGGDMTNC